MFPYAQTFTPPAPALDIEVINPLTGIQRTVLAKLDTAADETLIPEDLAADLNLTFQGYAEAAGFDGELGLYLTHKVDLIVGRRHFVELEVTAAPIVHILLGRDVLNQLFVTLDGPQLNFAIR
jgi:hypothetical protein